MKELDDYLDEVDYKYLNSSAYIPSEFALTFTNFIKLINGKEDWPVAFRSSKNPGFNKIIQGLERFEKIGFIGKLKLKRGLPLNASIFKLIRG